MALNQNSGFGLDVGERINRGKNKNTHTDTPTHTDTYIDEVPEIEVPKKENKTKRMFLLAKPSVYEKLDKYAKTHNDSVNNIVHTLMEEFIEKKGL